MIYQSEYEKSVYDKTDISHTFPPTREENLETLKNWQSSGPSTYLHAVAGKGWPYDHRAEDAFEVPPPAMLSDAYWEAHYENEKKLRAAQIDHAQKAPPFIIKKEAPQYSAAYTGSGKVILVLSTPDKTIGYFDTFADAQLAAEALNNHKGY